MGAYRRMLGHRPTGQALHRPASGATLNSRELELSSTFCAIHLHNTLDTTVRRQITKHTLVYHENRQAISDDGDCRYDHNHITSAFHDEQDGGNISGLQDCIQSTAHPRLHRW